MSKEVWKSIKGFSKYEVSTLGRVRIVANEAIMKPYLSNHYCKVSLTNDDGIQRHRRIHRLVADTFLTNPHNHPDIDHIDGVKTNNVVENIRWLSKSDNLKAWLKSQGITSIRDRRTPLRFTRPGKTLYFSSLSKACKHFKKARGTIFGAIVNCLDYPQRGWCGWRVERISEEDYDVYLAIQQTLKDLEIEPLAESTDVLVEAGIFAPKNPPT